MNVDGRLASSSPASLWIELIYLKITEMSQIHQVREILKRKM